MRFWYDNWYDTHIVDMMPSSAVVSNLNLVVYEVLHDNLAWILDDNFLLAFPDIVKQVESVVVSYLFLTHCLDACDFR